MQDIYKSVSGILWQHDGGAENLRLWVLHLLLLSKQKEQRCDHHFWIHISSSYVTLMPSSTSNTFETRPGKVPSHHPLPSMLSCHQAFGKCSFVCFSLYNSSLDIVVNGKKKESAFSGIEKFWRSSMRGSNSYALVILTGKVEIFFSLTHLAECATLLALFFSSIFFTKGKVT